MSALAADPDAPPTPAGLLAEDVERLSTAEITLLNAWHATVAGDDDGRPWWPRAVRSLTIEARLGLAGDEDRSMAWQELELRRCVSDVRYMVSAYGHVQPEEGPPIPFDLWPEQADALDAIVGNLRVVILKARQLGLTWLALHFAYHLMRFEPRTPNAKVLALSKTGEDAKKLLQRIRKVNDLMPPHLRLREDVETRQSNTRFKLEGRGEAISLMSTPAAARSETATLAIVDEFAHIRNRQAGPTVTALNPTLGSRGRAIYIFTGNGPAEAVGDGQAAARLWERAQSGDVDIAHVFLPDSVHPDRTDEWRARKRGEFLTEEEFLQEHPETPEDALAGQQGTKVYPTAGINAAVALGREYDELLAAGRMPPPAGALGRDGRQSGLISCHDWGEMSALLCLWPLEGGGLYVTPGEVVPQRAPLEPGQTTRIFHENLLAAGVQRARRTEGGGWLVEPPLVDAAYDAAGVQSERTFFSTVTSAVHERTPDVPQPTWPGLPLLMQWAHERRGTAVGIHTVKVPFGKLKDQSKNYLKRLFTRTAELRARRDSGEQVAMAGVIAISPRCENLIRQLRGLELKDDGSGKIEKGEDHAPDALLAGAAKFSMRWRA